MSRRKKKPNVQVSRPTALPLVAPPVTPPQAEQGKADTPKSGLKSVPWAIIISALSLLVSICSFVVADRQAVINQRQAEINQRNQDRASGKIRAQFDYIQERNDPALLKVFMKKADGFDTDVFRMDTLDDLFRWGPHVRIRNTGDEIIDGVRIEVEYVIGAAYGVGVEQKEPVPVVTNNTSFSEVSTFGKLMPKQTAIITLTPLLLDQMQQASNEVYPGKDRQAYFKVQVLCRIVGATTYDAIEPRKHQTLHLHWKQAVFSDRDRCETVRKLPPTVKVE